MWREMVTDIGLAVVFAVVGGAVGTAMVSAAALFLLWLMKHMMPSIDEEKEIARGNVAVAEYFGRITGACIIGISLVVAAAVLGGILAALHNVTPPDMMPPP